MAIERTDVARGLEGRGGEKSVPTLLDQLARFEGPPQEFLTFLLQTQCRLAPAESAAILCSGGEHGIAMMAMHPPMPSGGVQPEWLRRAAAAMPDASTQPAITSRPLTEGSELYGQPVRRHLVMVPLRAATGQREMAAFIVEARDQAALDQIIQRLEMTVALVGLYDARQAAENRLKDLRRLRESMETVAAVNEQERFAGLAMALCNELATRWQADRVGIGFLKGRYVHLKAMSHTEKFSRRMKTVQDIESAMEECIDQDLEVVFPASTEATYVSRAAGELSRRHGPTSVLSVPLRYSGKPVAAIVLERPADKPFMIDEAESLRLTADLITPRLASLEEHDRWVGARAVFRLRKGLGLVLSPKHTWIKAAGLALGGFLAFSIFVRGTYRVEAPFVLQPLQQQVVPAPFDGNIDAVLVEPGDKIVGGETVMARLETYPLQLRLGDARKEYIAYMSQADAAAAIDKPEKTAEALIARAQAASISAQIDLLEYQINQAEIKSPSSGIVMAGDLKRQVGAPVKTGQTLFEVAKIEDLRGEMAVSNDEIADVLDGQSGQLATASYPDRYIKFTVERINPMSDVVEHQTIFKVRVHLAETSEWMRPGMEGLAKIDVKVDGKDPSYLWIWTRPLVKWVRMKLWI
jgi:biotin carboxyl carrier protein